MAKNKLDKLFTEQEQGIIIKALDRYQQDLYDELKEIEEDENNITHEEDIRSQQILADTVNALLDKVLREQVGK